MLHKAFLEQLNRGVMIRNNNVSDDPKFKDNLERREKLLNSNIFILYEEGVSVGVKPVAFIDKDKLNVLWSVSAVRASSFEENSLYAPAVENLTQLEKDTTEAIKLRLEEMERDNLNIDAVMLDLGFKRFYGEQHGT